MVFNKILVVCLGNICRSPMVEADLKHRAITANLPVTVSSAGIAAAVGKPADPFVQELLQEQGIDCSTHKARQITYQMVIEADLVLVMEQQHRKDIEYMFPSACGKVHLLGKWGSFEIPDPYRKPKPFFRETYQLIVQGITEWQTRLWH